MAKNGKGNEKDNFQLTVPQKKTGSLYIFHGLSLIDVSGNKDNFQNQYKRNKTGLQTVSRPVEQSVGLFRKVKLPL